MQPKLVTDPKLTNSSQASLTFDPPLTKDVFDIYNSESPSEKLEFCEGVLSIKYSPVNVPNDWLDGIISDLQRIHASTESKKKDIINNHRRFVTDLGAKLRLPLDDETKAS
jgi:hypothetical protein